MFSIDFFLSEHEFPLSWKDPCFDWQRHLDNSVFSKELVRRMLLYALQNCSYPHIQMRIFVLVKTAKNIPSFCFCFVFWFHVSRMHEKQLTENLDNKQRNRQYPIFGLSAKRVILNYSVSYSYHLNFFYSDFRFCKTCLWPRKVLLHSNLL